MTTQFSILAWKIPRTEELAGYSPRGRKESVTPEHLSTSLILASYCWLPLDSVSLGCLLWVFKGEHQESNFLRRTLKLPPKQVQLSSHQELWKSNPIY